jgi:hypothetical protein
MLIAVEHCMKKISLTLILLLFFMFSIFGQFEKGFETYNQQRLEEYKIQPIEKKDYLLSGHFISSLSENMESEFLQMALFVLLTVNFYQIGSSESNKLPEQKTAKDFQEDRTEQAYSEEKKKQFPLLWPLYERSLTLALVLLFLIFFLLHAYGSYLLLNEQNFVLNKPMISFGHIFSEAEFWFESFQNWQSEFFSVATLCILSIFLRHKGSAQSKKMHHGLWHTGSH